MKDNRIRKDCGKYIAVLGAKELGEYKTAREAKMAYNKAALEIFTFPLLFSLEEEEDARE